MNLAPWLHNAPDLRARAHTHVHAIRTLVHARARAPLNLHTCLPETPHKPHPCRHMNRATFLRSLKLSMKASCRSKYFQSSVNPICLKNKMGTFTVPAIGDIHCSFLYFYDSQVRTCAMEIWLGFRV